jgi:hypothetical protein
MYVQGRTGQSMQARLRARGITYLGRLEQVSQAFDVGIDVVAPNGLLTVSEVMVHLEVMWLVSLSAHCFFGICHHSAANVSCWMDV